MAGSDQRDYPDGFSSDGSCGRTLFHSPLPVWLCIRPALTDDASQVVHYFSFRMVFRCCSLLFPGLMQQGNLCPLAGHSRILVWPSPSNLKKTLTGYSSVFIFYLLLRWLMLGSVIGGYSRGIEWGAMLCYLIKSLPRLLQTVVWGGAAPGEFPGRP